MAPLQYANVGFSAWVSNEMIFDISTFFNIPDEPNWLDNYWPLGNANDPNRGITWYSTNYEDYPNPRCYSYSGSGPIYLSGGLRANIMMVLNDGVRVTTSKGSLSRFQHIGYNPPIPLYAYPLDISPILDVGTNSIFFEAYSGPLAPSGMTKGGDGLLSPIYFSTLAGYTYIWTEVSGEGIDTRVYDNTYGGYCQVSYYNSTIYIDTGTTEYDNCAVFLSGDTTCGSAYMYVNDVVVDLVNTYDSWNWENPVWVYTNWNEYDGHGIHKVKIRPALGWSDPPVPVRVHSIAVYNDGDDYNVFTNPLHPSYVK